MRATWRACGLAWAVAVSGCGFVHDDADALLARGQPEAALRQLEASGPPGSNAPAQARYGLRRGLAHLALGDTDGARRWLGHAKQLTDRAPTTLDAPDRARLLDALRSLSDAPLRAG